MLVFQNLIITNIFVDLRKAQSKTSESKGKSFEKKIVLLKNTEPSRRPTKKEVVDLNARGLGEQIVEFSTLDSMQKVYDRILKYVMNLL